jgi:hypothetical protein
MSKRTYSFDILANIDQAVKQIAALSGASKKELDSINLKATISSVRDAIGLVGVVKDKFAEFFGHAIEEATQAEESIRLLNNAMRITGEYSQVASDRALEFAKNLSQVTVYTDNQITSTLALAKSYGLANSESRKLVAAATELAAVTGQDLNSAVATLAATYNGFISKELLHIYPELKRLTAQQKAAGEAVDFFAKKLGGSALEATQTFNGQLVQARKDVDAFEQGIGNFLLRAGSDFIRWGKEAKGVVAEAFADIKRASLNADAQTSIFDQVSATIKKTRALNIEDQKEEIARAKEVSARKLQIASDAAKEARAKAKSEFEAAQKETTIFGLTGVERIQADFAKTRKIFEKAITLGIFKDKVEQEKAFTRIAMEEARKVAEERKKLNIQLGTNPGSEAVKAFSGDPTSAFNQVGNDPRAKNIAGASLATGAVTQVLQGAAGAQKLVTQSLAQVAEVMTGIPAEISGPLLEALSGGPEKVKEMVKQFTDAIPTILTAILESIPALISAFVDAAPKLVKTLVEKIPEVIDAIIGQLPALFVKVATFMPTIGVALVEGIISNIPKLISAFAKEFLKIPEQFAKALLDAINPVSGGGNRATGGDGGVFSNVNAARVGVGIATGGLSEVGHFLGLFADGGTTPRIPSLNGDRGVARLSGNETVIDSELTDWFRQMKNAGGGLGGGANQPDIVVKIGVEEFARISFKARKAGYQL